MTWNPIDWNIVIVGAWNLAILTPQGIGSRLLKIKDETAMEVQVALDELAPIRVIHEGVRVVPASDRLSIWPLTLTKDALVKAAEVGRNALIGLPETPVRAAGVNIKFHSEGTPDELTAMLKSPIDGNLADAGKSLIGHGLRRTIKWEPGIENISVSTGSKGESRVEFNFHLEDKRSGSLATWLEKTASMADEAFEIAQNFFKIKLEG